jgi:hypothetical protein
MTAQELEQTRSAWDKIAAGYDEFVTPRTRPWEGMRFAAPASVRACDSWTSRPAAVPSASPRRGSAHRCFRRTCLPSCSSGSRRA